MAEIKNIVFDIGNVLLEFNPEKYVREFGFSKEIEEQVMAVVFKGKEWVSLDRGILNEKAALEIFIKKYPDLKSEIEIVMKGWKEILHPMNESITILKKLHSLGYHIYFLSNFHREAFQEVYKKNDFLKLCEGKVISYQYNILKPEPAIYEKLLQLYNLKGNETLFIDDSCENVEGAERLGIKGKVFVGAKDLDEYLHKMLEREGA